MRLPRRLIGRFILSAVLIGAVVGAVGLHATVKLDQSASVATDIGKRLLPTIDLIGEMRATMTRVRLGATRVLDDTEAKAVARARERNQSRIAEMQQFIDRYDQLTKDTGDGPAFEAFRSQWRAYIAQQSAALDLSGSDGRAARELFNGPANQLYDTAWKSLEAMKAAGSRAAQEAADRVATERKTSLSTILGGTGLGVMVALLLMGWLARDVARNAVRVAAAMKSLAAGDTDTDVPCTGRTDEIGDIAVAALGFRESLIRSRQLEAETALAHASVEEQRKAGMRQMADSFEAAVGGIVSTVSSSATELQATSQTMTATATQTASQSTSVAAAAEEAASNVGTVAVAARQLGNSVQEIGRQVAGSASLAQAAVSEADQTARLVQTLSQAVSKIGDVAGLISSIAEQTNLLALNATIEAARAGQAGRGFAVVAAEVKELAGQTARATEEITGHIHRIQDSTGHAVSAIGGIAGRIREINAVAATIAAAVEEQGAATQEIVRSVAQAAAGTGEVVTNIAGVAGAVQDTGAAACQVLDAASELSRQSEFLAHEVTRFLQTVRAA